MKTRIKYLMSVVTVALSALCCHAADSNNVDTVYFYNSWEQMLDIQP